MKIIERVIEHSSRSDWLKIVPLFDLHVGNSACDEVLLKRTVDDIADDPLCWWIGGGDYCDFINRKDRRYRETSTASWLWGVNDIAERQIERLTDLLKPIKDKCLGLLKGNHEDSVLQHYERDVYSRLVDRVKPDAGTPVMLGWQGFLRLKTRNLMSTGAVARSWMVTIYLHHGYGGGRMEGGDALALGRVFKNYDCDIALMGHRHKKISISQIQLSPGQRSKKVRERYQVAAFCGSFLRGYSEDEVYPESKGLPPLPVGAIEIMLHPDKRVVKCAI